MKSREVVSLYQDLEQLGIKIWLDGGWGVDALLEEQTRPHSDLDITIEKINVPKLREFLSSKNYKDFPRDDTSDWNFVMGDEEGSLVDVHVIEFDESGNGIYGPKENGVTYPKSAFSGKGFIDGVEVRCLSPEYQLVSHSGYELKDKDYKDIAALKEKFGKI